MPRIFNVDKWVVFFWSGEGVPLEPIHVHVSLKTPQIGATKIWLTSSGGCLLANKDRRVLAEPILVSLGTSSVTTTIHPGEVFAAGLKADAKAVVVAHNHPSGNATPSAQDRELTTALKRLGEALGVTVLDHLVVVGDSFCHVTSIDCKNG